MEDWQRQSVISLWIWVGILLTLLFVFFIWILIKTYLKKIEKETKERHKIILELQQELLENSIEIQERERKRIAANVHDDLIAQLHRIKLTNSDQSVNQLLNTSIKTARLISHDLIPPLVEQLSLEELVQDFVAPLMNQFNVHIYFYEVSDFLLSTTQKLHLFRIVQEIITNSVKHSKAQQITIIRRQSKNSFCLIISDDGIGYDSTTKQGLGLANIESRNQILNGTFRLRKTPKAGTTFLFILKNNYAN